MLKKLSDYNIRFGCGRAKHHSPIAMQGLQGLLRELVEQIPLFHIRRFKSY